jgi:hypothetical protein
MEFSTVKNNELESIKELQPEGWSDITESIKKWL